MCTNIHIVGALPCATWTLCGNEEVERVCGAVLTIVGVEV